MIVRSTRRAGDAPSLLAAMFAAASLAFGAAPAFAQAHPVFPAPVRPALPVTPVGRSLGSAFDAIQAARTTNPAAAQAAASQYALARERLLEGDRAGALAAADIARSLAGQPSAGPLRPTGGGQILPYAPTAQGIPGVGTLRQPVLGAPTGTTPATATVPLAGGVPSMQLLVARNEIDLAERLGGGDLAAAKAKYRDALDKYHSGDAAGANRAASEAYDLAAKRLNLP